METITSITNTKIQFVKKLSDKKNRIESGLFVVEGGNIIKDLPDNIVVDMLIAQDDKLANFDKICERYADKLIVVNEKVMHSVSDTVNPCGLLAVLQIPNKKFVDRGDCVVLDGVADPGNFGAVIRTCVACGIENIFAVNCVDWTSPKVVRSSMGGIFRVNIIQSDYTQIAELLHNYTIIALDMAGKNIFEYQRDKSKQFALVVGNEANGLSQEMRQMRNELVALPMIGDIESLNAAVSASVGLYQLVFGDQTKK
ncbi:MAG: RNA methyltransferase [Clostridia bacterium]